MVITDETVEERKQRLSDEADRADKLARVQAEDQTKERTPDDEETEDEDVFKEQQLRQAQTKRDAKVVDRLARLKIDRYKLVGEDKLLVKQGSQMPRASSPQWRGQLSNLCFQPS